MAPDESERAEADLGPAPPDRAGPSLPDVRRETPESDDAISFEEIRERAYELWERNHRPEGLEIQFWLVAERELRAERERRPAGKPEVPTRGA